MTNDLQRANDIAAQTALMVLLRAVIAEAFFHPDRAEFRRRLAALEQSAVDTITNEPLWPGADAVTLDYLRGAASGWISRSIAGILHPQDRAGD